MRTGYLEMTSNFPASIAVPSQKTSKKKGYEGQPLTKFHRGIVLEEKDCLSTKNYAIKIHNYFQKYHLGVSAVGIIFPVVFLMTRICTLSYVMSFSGSVLLKPITFLLSMTRYVYFMVLIQSLKMVFNRRRNGYRIPHSILTS
jgi:hypothetical protein